jgi:hypothetical protein
MSFIIQHQISFFASWKKIGQMAFTTVHSFCHDMWRRFPPLTSAYPRLGTATWNAFSIGEQRPQRTASNFTSSRAGFASQHNERHIRATLAQTSLFARQHCASTVK